MKLLVINNLVSGYGEGAVYDFMRALATAGDEITVRSVDASSNFNAVMQDASSFDCVIAAGGDGTVASVCYELRNSGVPILPFPAGTANLLTINTLSATEPHALAKMVRNGTTLDFDMGEIEIDGTKRGFTIMAGCGYDAIIMNGAKATKHLLGPLSYLQAAFANPRPQTAHFTITVDDKVIERDGVGILLVNFSKLQFDISVTEKSLPRDGYLDLVVLTTPTALELIPTVLAATVDHSGDAVRKSDAIEVYKGKEFLVEAQPAMELQYDGEACGLTTPFRARVLPHAARLFMSEEGYSEFTEES